MSRKPLVYIVDDDPSVCRALALLLESHGFKAKTFTRSADFLAHAHPKVPSCLLLDFQLPDINGLALQKAIAERRLPISIVFITGHGDIPMSVKAMKAGAIDFLPKPFTDEKLLAAVRQAIARNKIQTKEEAEVRKIKRRVNSLSPREQEVFRLVVKGLLSKQIAYKWGISLQTVKVHRARVMQKMGAKTVTELIRFAEKCGISSCKH